MAASASFNGDNRGVEAAGRRKTAGPGQGQGQGQGRGGGEERVDPS